MHVPKMKAIVCTKYGSPDYLQVQEVAKPQPKENEILIKVKATTVTKADTMMRRAEPFISRFFLGFFKPRNSIMGTGFSGVVEQVGKAVKDYQKGDLVFGETGVNFSANAEYICLPQDGVLASKPSNLSHEEAAPLCDGPLTSLNFLKNLGNIKAGQKVLINGASGSLGTAAVQLAKYYGAEVTGVCSTRNIALVKSLGADKVVDYTTTDFTQTGEKYDIIYDTVGKSSFSRCKNVLSSNGLYLSPVLNMRLLFQMMWTSKMSSQKAMFSATGLLPPPELRLMLEELTAIIKKGKLKMVIDSQYALEEAVTAHYYVDRGHKRGSVVLIP